VSIGTILGNVCAGYRMWKQIGMIVKFLFIVYSAFWYKSTETVHRLICDTVPSSNFKTHGDIYEHMFLKVILLYWRAVILFYTIDFFVTVCI
jgi:hypothetical protein